MYLPWNVDHLQWRWTRQLPRGSAPLPHLSPLKLASLPLVSGTSSFCAWLRVVVRARRTPLPHSPFFTWVIFTHLNGEHPLDVCFQWALVCTYRITNFVHRPLPRFSSPMVLAYTGHHPLSQLMMQVNLMQLKQQHWHRWVPGVHNYRYYRSLVKERPWVEHLTSLPKRGLGTLLRVSPFNHERAPMYAYSDPQNHWIIGQTILYNGAANLGSSHSDMPQHSEWLNATVS